MTALAGTGKRQRNMNSVVLAGIMIGSLFTALVSLVKFSADTESQLPAITYWLMGSLDAASYDSLLLGAPPILAGITVLILLRWRLNLLPLSDEEARTTGVNIKAIRVVTILCATLITGSVISMCGQVGWVGLLIPHMCRMKFGNNHVLTTSVRISRRGFLDCGGYCGPELLGGGIPNFDFNSYYWRPILYLLNAAHGRLAVINDSRH
ncbi:vitamin B12 ABC transporter, permease component BtuC [Agrilactobacillus composti DSM 18527 = JCM 14202]|nr:iron ABC transporter permease [Agrilactobacillus composti]GAF41829.1 vitamin B12 ABC transporter, permease component BtuC [Agrilactobacillus composti DSM 18527 = JCM 14202]